MANTLELLAESRPDLAVDRRPRLDRISYAPEMFVETGILRRDINLVTGLINRYMSRDDKNRRSIHLSGEAGSGKTWLMYRLKEILGLQKLDVTYIDCLEDPQFIDYPTDLPEGSVLLLDNIYQLEWEDLEKLEAEFITPLMTQDKVAFIFSGRGRLFPWANPQLRIFAEPIELGNFDRSQTFFQLKSQAPGSESRAEEIHQLSGGYPLANYALTKLEPDQALDYALGEMLKFIPSSHNRSVRNAIQALSVLDGFNEVDIPPILESYLGQDMPAQSQRAVRDLLLSYSLAGYDTEKGRYRIPPAVRILAENFLRVINPELWRNLHQTAQEHFEELAENFEGIPATLLHFSQRTEYHQQQLSLDKS